MSNLNLREIIKFIMYSISYSIIYSYTLTSLDYNTKLYALFLYILPFTFIQYYIISLIQTKTNNSILMFVLIICFFVLFDIGAVMPYVNWSFFKSARKIKSLHDTDSENFYVLLGIEIYLLFSQWLIETCNVNKTKPATAPAPAQQRP